MAAFRIEPVTPDRWDDLTRLFGPNGAYANCWCMWWRMPAREFDGCTGAQRRAGLERIVAEGQVPGLLAYVDGEPAAWCAVQPRDAYPRLQRSRVAGPVDDAPVWAVTCLYVSRPVRRRGLSVALLEAAAERAAAAGAPAVEGCPVDKRGPQSPAAIFTGTAESFRRAGFTEIERRSPTRPIMRRTL